MQKKAKRSIRWVYHATMELLIILLCFSVNNSYALQRLGFGHRKTTNMINATLGPTYTGTVSRGKEDMYYVNSTEAVRSATEKVLVFSTMICLCIRCFISLDNFIIIFASIFEVSNHAFLSDCWDMSAKHLLPRC